MPETLSDTQLRLESIIRDNFPDVDLAPGTVLSELLMKLNVVLQNPIKNDTLALSQANSVSTALSSAVDTYNAVIDEVASNYNTVRNAGKKSTGKIKVIVTKPASYFIKTGFTFYQPVLKLNYTVQTQYTVRTGAVDADELPLIKEGNFYYFLVPVEAEDVGGSYQVSNGAKFSTAEGDTISGFVDASAYGNFTTGLPIETDKVLISRFQEGISNKSLLTQKSILFRLQELYPNVRAVSTTGANDEELIRAKHNLLGVSMLGMVDVYIRSSLGPETKLLTKTATRTNSVWTLTIDAEDAPGFYRIVSILPSGKQLTGTILHTDTYGYSTAGIMPANYITNLSEARFTQYQNCTVTFGYDSELTSADFDVVVSYQPDIANIQSLFNNSSERILCADYLVKAVLPCYVSVDLRLHRQNTTIDLPVEQIKQDIYNYINTIPIGEKLYASKLVDICHNYDVKYVEYPVKLSGNIYTNTGEVLSITDREFLEIPKRIDVGVSEKTTTFFADYFKSDTSNILEQTSVADGIGITVF